MVKALFRILAALLLMTLVIWLVGPARLLAAFANADPFWLGAGLCAALTASVSSALRWHSIAAWLGIHAARRTMLIAYWRGITANTLLPGANLGGDTLRAVHLHQAGHSLALAAASVLLDRLSGLWVLIVLSLSVSAVGQFSGALPASVLPWPAGATLLLTLLALAAPPLAWSLSAAGRHLLPSKLANLLVTLHALPRPLSQYVKQLGWSAAVQLFSILAFACAGYGVGIDLPAWEFVIAAGPIFILAAMPLSVGGWGTREAASALVLGLFGVGREQAVAAAILYGLYAAVQGLAGGLTLLQRKNMPVSNPGEHHA